MTVIYNAPPTGHVHDFNGDVNLENEGSIAICDGCAAIAKLVNKTWTLMTQAEVDALAPGIIPDGTRYIIGG